MITIDDQESLIEWAGSKMDGPDDFAPDAKAIGQIMNGRINAVVVFDAFSACDAHMHIASDGSRHWLTRELVLEAFHYPFVQLGLRRVTGLVPSKNGDAIRFDLKMGFKIEGRCFHALPDDDMIILGMLREHCRFIPKEYRHGQENSERTGARSQDRGSRAQAS